MRILFAALLFLFSTQLFGQPSNQSDWDKPQYYTLGSGDTLRIFVFGEPDLSFDEIRLTDSGSFSYPFLGDISAKGKTSSQVEETIIAGLKGDYLIDPKVNVSIVEYRPFYMNGEVKKPGGYPFKPGLTLRKAIALAGGFTERASRKKFKLIRDNQRGKPLSVDDLETRIYPGDIITIEESFF